MAYVYDLADTWNNSTTTFTAIKMNVTDTASSASSLLIDLQVNGVNRLSLRKSGVLILQGTMVDTTSTVVFSPSGYNLNIQPYSGAGFDFSGFNGFRTPAGVAFGTNFTNVVRLERDADNVLAQRNGVNAQTFNLYNTYTNDTNYERGFMRWASNILRIGTEKGTTGTTRALELQIEGVTRVRFDQFYNDQLGGSGTRIYSSGLGGTTGIISFIQGGISGFAGGIAFTATSFGWSAGAYTGADAGLIRTAAAQLKVTNGSTGTGQLIFIVPTTNPGITGALWNNAGTLSISA